MNIDSLDEAIAVVEDKTQEILTRESALYYLGRHPEPRGLQCLVEALEDEDFGIRWAAAVTLANLGDEALEPLLRALIERSNSVWMREGAHHVFFYSASRSVRQCTENLLSAMRGLAADVSTEVEAARLLNELSRTA